jgi:hypothetical protein
LGAVIGGLLLAALAAQIAFEFREWTPTWVDLLIKRAVRRLPVELQDRMSEEWTEYVSAMPGWLAKLFRALGLNVAAISIACERANSITPWHSAASRLTGLALLIFLLPMFGVSLGLAVVFGQRDAFIERRNGLYCFRITDPSLKQTFERSSLDYLPALFNIVRGDIHFTMSGVKNVLLDIFTKRRW